MEVVPRYYNTICVLVCKGRSKINQLTNVNIKTVTHGKERKNPIFTRKNDNSLMTELQNFCTGLSGNRNWFTPDSATTRIKWRQPIGLCLASWPHQPGPGLAMNAQGNTTPNLAPFIHGNFPISVFLPPSLVYRESMVTCSVTETPHNFLLWGEKT